MARSLFSSSWYRVAEMRPRLRPHTEIHRQRFRGETWYILQDHQTGRFHRISPSANLMICLMDGRRTVAEIWDAVGAKAGDDPPTQDEAIQLLTQLHTADVLHSDVPPDFAEIAERSERAGRREMMSKLRNPLALRLPVFDPDRFLSATVWLVRPLFTRAGFVAWLALIVAATAIAALEWPSITGDSFAQAISAENLILIAVAYPVVKFFHEAGHAYATKVWGGEVHEAGFMFLIFIPVPYVDASSSAAFREKSRRMVVGGIGVMVELALAALALIVWLNVEPGLVRTFAFNVMIIASVSTLIFNGNPLLRFDGYYVLADWLEIPNFATRANRYFFYVVQRYLLGVEGIDSPATHPSERKWLFGYAVLAAAYRLVVVFGIAALVATKLFFIGILLALWAVASSLAWPVAKGIGFVFTSPKLRGRRRHALLVTGAAAAVFWVAFFLVPLPYATVAQGVVLPPEEAIVRARTDGIVTAVATAPDSDVEAGKVLLSLDDPTLDSRVEVLRALLEEFQLRYDAVRVLDRVQSEMIGEQVKAITARLDAFERRRADLAVTAPTAGRFLLPGADDLPGRFVKRGDLIGYVLAPSSPMLRVVVPQATIDLVRQRTGRVEVRLADRPAETFSATVLREVPAAQRDLPSLALSTRGGGDIALDPSSREQRTLEGLFIVDVAVTGGAVERLGGRAYVRFDHGEEALAWRIARGIRQLFLGHFGV